MATAPECGRQLERETRAHPSGRDGRRDPRGARDGPALPSLDADSGKTLRFKGKRLEALAGRFLIVRVDALDEVPESGEDNDRPWQLLD